MGKNTPERQDFIIENLRVTAMDSEGAKYVVKGDGDPMMVLAEHLGHTLARAADVLVPDFHVANMPDSQQPLFASSMIEENRVDEIERFIRRGRVTNLESLL
jgi:hypothetical protein